jgi:hypothetical protein
MIPTTFHTFIEGRVNAIKSQYRRDQSNTALICTTIANFALKAKRGGRVFKVKDFMPKEKQTPTDMLRVVEQLNKRFGGVDLRKNKP